MKFIDPMWRQIPKLAKFTRALNKYGIGQRWQEKRNVGSVMAIAEFLFIVSIYNDTNHNQRHLFALVLGLLSIRIIPFAHVPYTWLETQNQR